MMKKTKPKRNKTYVPKARYVPELFFRGSMLSLDPDIPLKSHLAFVSLIEAPTLAACDALIGILLELRAALGALNDPELLKDDDVGIALRSAELTVHAIRKRAETSPIAVTALEAQSLRAAAGVLSEVWEFISVRDWNVGRADLVEAAMKQMARQKTISTTPK